MRAALALVAVAVAVAGTTGGAAAAPPRDPCFSVTYGMNSRGTNAVFRRLQQQSGGPTWGAILESLVKRATSFVRVADEHSDDMPSFGQPMVVTYRGAQTWYLLDDEGESATFCAGAPQLLAAARADYKRLNGNAKALEEAIARIPPAERE
ncbi:MAG TPA: hypothetical protein VF945_19740 [Polyangia bacterium]